MVVDDLDIQRVSLFPAEADPPSFIDPDAVLILPVSAQTFEAVAGGRRQVLQNPCPVEVEQLPARRPLKCPESCDRHIVEETLSIPVFEGLDHCCSLLRIAYHVKGDTSDVSPRFLRGGLIHETGPCCSGGLGDTF
jgi:hypothetical protein